MKAAFLAVAVLAFAGIGFYFSTGVYAAKASGPQTAAHKALAPRSVPKSVPKSLSNTVSLPLFFEPNQGQTAPQVKFFARGAGYGLFLTADEAVLQLQASAVSTQHSAAGSQRAPSSVIRMRLDGANASARVSGASPLPGKSSYFIGNDPSKWRRDIPQFARVQYEAVYPGVDLVYYGNQGQLEYDFRVAPAADPKQIALSFQGASAHIISGDSDDSGDLILATASGDIHFHAPHVYQPATPQSGNASGNAEKAVAGSFRQLADNKIGFIIGDYDHSRELVIDPVLSYSTYLGGSGVEGGSEGSNPENLVKIAIDPAGFIYVAGSTTSANFPFPVPPNTNDPIQASLEGAQNIFIAVINPTLQPPIPPDEQLVYATYLGGSATDSLAVDSLAGIAVDTNRNIYVAGTTTAPDFPTTSNALPQPGAVTGTHGFLSALTLSTTQTIAYNLTYSTYLAGTNAAGNATDTVTGLAIDRNQNAYVTGVTTSSNPETSQYPFPASPSGYQTVSNSPGNLQFFASKINTAGNGSLSMLYSTYFGGGYPATAIAIGGGIAVDPSPNTAPNMYITGTTTMLQVNPNGGAAFPLLDAQQSCLNEASKHGTCLSNNVTTTPDAFVAKINPNPQTGGIGQSSLIYSTYLGGSGDDHGNAIDVDTSGNAYVIGSTDSTDWVSVGTGFQTKNGGGPHDAFIAKIGNLSGSVYPLNYFTYLGGSGDDTGQDIKVDTVGTVHVVGSTTSTDLPVTTNTLQPCLGEPGVQPPCPSSTATNAFVALIGTSLSGRGAGDYLTYLGGSLQDQGTGIALDSVFGATYVAGTTQSSNFPLPLSPPAPPPYQGTLNGSQDAFVSKIGASSTLVITVPSTSPAPFPAVAAGSQVAFTFDITNTGTDPANQVVFTATGLPTSGLASPVTAIVKSGSGSCDSQQGSTIACTIQTLAVCSTSPPPCSPATIEVDLTPAVPIVNSEITISGIVSANGGPVGASVSQPVEHVVDFAITASTPTPINAGDTATIQVTFCPAIPGEDYTGTITPSQTTNPSMVTATTPIFTPTTVALSGSACEKTTLSIVTVARPVTTGSLLRRGSFYATWLPIGGLSMIGLGIGVGRRRRRWLVGAVVCVIAGAILLQSGCGSASSSTPTPGGTQAGIYTITISGSAGTGASHSYPDSLTVR
jgi:uncharacterized repeat protein (TIGR01451 family)